MSVVRWSHLSPDPSIVTAVDHAGLRSEQRSQNEKRRWSQIFVNACAVALAEKFRGTAIRSMYTLPWDFRSGTEWLTPLATVISKHNDIAISDPMLGLKIGVALKELNFRDAKIGHFDRNSTGRLCELGDEVQLVHKQLPRTSMVGMLVPLMATEDKTDRANSSFATTVLKLRERTGRLDVTLPGHAVRCDAAYVGLYSLGADPTGFARGVARCFAFGDAPPRRGRPRIELTKRLVEVASEIVSSATFAAAIECSKPEVDE